MTPVVLHLPVVTQSELNSREHWRARSARAKSHREAVALLWPRGREDVLNAASWDVHVIRVAPRQLDAHDNLPSSQKHIVDAVTECLGLKNDRDPRLTIHYGQERGKPRSYSVRVIISPRQ